MWADCEQEGEPARYRVRTIKDLAELAGVSTGTVSRALAGSELIGAATRARIQALAEEHGFRPNALARNLRTRRTGAIGVVVPLEEAAGLPLSDALCMALLGRVAEALAARHYDLLLLRAAPGDAAGLEAIIDSGRVDGLIVIGEGMAPEALAAVARRYRPLVVWGGPLPGQRYCSVGTDNRRGGDMAASHLIAQGCRRLAFLGDPALPETAERLQGCHDAMTRAGLAPPLPVVAPHAVEAGLAALWDGPMRPQGLVAASDALAMSALRALAEQGVAVPGEVRVVGYDGLALGEHTVPRLTTIRQDLAGGAERMVDLLLRRMAGEATPSVTLAPELLVRLSG